VTLVWFKKDLRVRDNAPLSEVLSEGMTLGFFCLETEWLKTPSFQVGKWNFLCQALDSLREELTQLRVPLLIRKGDVVEELDLIQHRFPFSNMHSHEEVGELWTYRRDLKLNLLRVNSEGS
jgi:deoxyribodipyrimidine photo-lyase